MTIEHTRHTTSDMRAVTAAEIAAYREVLRAAIGSHTPTVGVPQSSPVYPFVLSSPAFEQVMDQLTPAGEPRAANVHLSQEVHLHRLVRPGERVAVDVEVVAARREPKGVRLAIRSVLVGDHGALLAELLTGALLVDAAAPEPFGDMPVAAALVAGPGPREDTTVECVIPRETVARYAEVSGDHNPIHVDDDAAIAAGFPGAIAHGMSVLALVCEDVVDRFAGGDAGRIAGVGCRFSSPVRPDEPLSIVYQTDGGPTVKFSLRTERGIAFKAGWVRVRPVGEGSDG